MSRALTLREYDKRSAEILARMKEEATPFRDDSEEAREKRIAMCRDDRMKFGEIYMPHYFYKPWAPIHYDLNEKLSIENRIVPFAGPRGSGKTAIAFTLTHVHEICMGIGHFKILAAQEADPHAIDQGKFIKQELDLNPRIRQDFGDLAPPVSMGDKDFETENGIRILTRGLGQGVKGLRHGVWRPDRFTATDMETPRSARSPKMIKKVISWLTGEVRGSFGIRKGYHIFMEGQIIEKKCALGQLLKMEDEDGNLRYPGSIYSAIGDDGASYWPEAYPLGYLLEIKRDMGTIEFNRWYQNDPVDEEGLFQERWIRYYHPSEIQVKPLRVFGFADLSAKHGQEHDFRALIIIGIDENGTIYVLDAFIRRCSINTFARTLYNRWIEYDANLIAAEENALGEFMDFAFDRIGRDMGISKRPRGISHTTDKTLRIGRLSSPVEHGTIRFLKNHSDQNLLVEQLIYFPSTTVNDDGPDALAGAVEVMEKFNQKIEYRSVQKRRFAEVEGTW